MSWLALLLTAGCAVIGLIHVVRVVLVPAHRVAEASSAAMGLGMAAMFSPLGNPVPDAVWVVGFVLCAVWFAAMAARARGSRADELHHVVCSAAMLFMLGGHAHHGGASGVVSVAAVVFAGYFGWHVLRCVDRLHVARAAPGRAATLASPMPAAVAHLGAALVMTAMLMGMV